MSRLVKVALLAALMLALSAGVALAATIVGTAGPDSISVGFTGQNDQIFTLEGNDTVDAYDGNDDVYGNENNDTLFGAEDSDRVYGNSGRDTLNLQANDVPDQFPSAPSDQGFGGAGNDRVFAQDGNVDVINCGAGTDTAFLTPGQDSQTGCESINPAGVASEPPAPPR